jgi:hypothetical protein
MPAYAGKCLYYASKEGFAFGEHSSLVTENYKQLFANSFEKKWKTV